MTKPFQPGFLAGSAQAYLRASTYGHGDDTSSISVTLPTNAVGDLMLVMGGSSFISNISMSGWTQLLKDTSGTGFVYYKVSTGSESSASIANGAGGGACWMAYAIGNAYTTPEISSVGTGTSTAPNPPSLTPSWGNRNTFWIALATSPYWWAHGANDFGTLTGFPSNYSNGLVVGCYETHTESAEGGSVEVESGAGAGSAYRIVRGTSEDPGTFTSSYNGAWRCYTIGVRGK